MAEEMNILTILFDLDDTLIYTSKIYHRSRRKFFSALSGLGFLENEVLEKLDDIDIGHVSEQGFTKERYSYSLIKTYHYFCKKAGREPESKIEKEISEIGWKVYLKKPEQVKGAKQVLNYLKNKYKLILATLGDPEIQHNKISQSGLQSYFSAIHVMKHKSDEEYTQILERHQLKKEDTWIIGNSVRSDLNPGLRIGINCILIPAGTWKFEEEDPISNNYLRLDCLTDILDYL